MPWLAVCKGCGLWMALNWRGLCEGCEETKQEQES